MTKWKKISDHPLPKNKQFFAIWKGTACIAQYDDEINQYCICFLPVACNVMEVPKERENKFTHWAEIEHPDDY